MTIPVTTRSGKGSPLTPGEMDANLTQLARDASQAQQGNARFATAGEAGGLAAADLAIAPSTFTPAFTPAFNSAFNPAFNSAFPPAFNSAFPPAIAQYFANYAAAGGVSNNFPGYFRFPNGPLVQYGSYNFGGGPTTQAVPLAVAYPSANYAVTVIAFEAGGDDAAYFVCKGKNPDNFVIKVYGGNSFVDCLWIAVGPF